MSNHLESNREIKNALYELVFALIQDEKDSADEQLERMRLWKDVYPLLRDVTVVDPACGSGSFLVGMLHVLDDLQERASKYVVPIPETNYERKKRIIGNNLYGVDVMEWACHVAELRLWLALIIDAEIPREELHIRSEALLPNFTFNIRHGDSLVQEFGGINLANAGGTYDSQKIGSMLKVFKREKYKFYSNDPGCKFKTPSQAKQAELNLFKDMLLEQKAVLQQKINNNKQAMRSEQSSLFGGTSQTISEKDKAKLENEIVQFSGKIKALDETYEALRNATTTPFAWDIAFVEMFKGDKKGFDIVIGNPPYVRQEQISDPRLLREQVNTTNKKEYKGKLARAMYEKYPFFFGSNPKNPKHKIDAKSDLYIYFYLDGLSLLNEKGSFCFITSNSWLDVGYGKDLQEFLLKHCHIKLIIDNQVKRSFASADVNTIIALFSAVDKERKSGFEKTSRFVMFTEPFENIMDTVIFEEIEESGKRKSVPEFKVHPMKQKYLYAEKLANQDGKEEYLGNKWGGKYLRAPDIYWVILEKGKDKLVRLGDIAEVRFGIKTGANEFFYLDKAKIAQWGIEDEFLKPVIKSPRECRSILIKPENLKFKIFMCHKEKRELQGTAAAEYIRWGEEQGYNERPSCSGRPRWWDFGIRRKPPVISPSSVNDIYRAFFNEANVLIDKRLYEIYLPDDLARKLTTSLNAILTSMMIDLGSRVGLGEGLIDLTVYEVADCLVVHPKFVESIILDRDIENYKDELNRSDRRDMDNIIFDVLALTQTERDSVYEAVIKLVETRLNKASSLKK